MIRAAAAFLGAAALAAALLYLAATGTGDLLAPLSRGVSIGIPIAAAGAIVLGTNTPRWFLALLATVGATALAVASAITAGWVPLPWLGYVWPWLALSAVAAGVGLPMLGNARVRLGAAAFCVAAPLVGGRLDAGPPTVDAAITVTGSREILAPAHEVWEALLDSLPAGARLADTEEPERVRVALEPVTIAPARGAAAWRRVAASDWVVPTAAAYDLAPLGDTAAAVNGAGTYRLAVHARALPASWVRAAADRRHAIALDSLRARSEARLRADPPRLTAEMRRLRAELDTVWRDHTDRFGEGDVALALFQNGEGRAEIPQDLPAVQETLDATVAALRTALLQSSARARTTAWLSVIGASTRLEFEDYHGRCIAETGPERRPGAPTGLMPQGQLSRCAGTAMAERARRSRVIARLALEAGQPDDRWSVAPVVRGETRVYLDSIVFRADTLRLTGKEGSEDSPVVDTIFAGLSVKTERAWFVARRGTALPLGRAFKPGDVWERNRLRFTIPVDSSYDLSKAWPTFELVMALPKTADNPYGRGWTYAHAPMAYFSGVRR